VDRGAGSRDLASDLISETVRSDAWGPQLPPGWYSVCATEKMFSEGVPVKQDMSSVRHEHAFCPTSS
jgi:hypothetical protein